MQSKLYLLVLCAVSVTLAQDPLPTPFPNVWSANFVEHLYDKKHGHTQTKGTWYYDWTLKKFLIVRQNGATEQLCGPVSNFKKTECHTLVTGGKRYLYYPETKYCCFCCADAHGCGMEKPNWFVNGKYLGEKHDQGYTVNIWDVKANQPNYVTQVAQGPYAGRTLRVFQVPDSNLVYDVTSVKTTVDPKLFNLPVGQNCQQLCPATTLCGKFRSRGMKKVKDLVDQ